MLDLEHYRAFERALDAAADAGATPLRWSMTSALYENLDAGPGHFAAAQRAIAGAEQPIPLYGLPVEIDPDAFHSWRLITDRGQYGVDGRFVEYSTNKPSHDAPPDKP